MNCKYVAGVSLNKKKSLIFDQTTKSHNNSFSPTILSNNEVNKNYNKSNDLNNFPLLTFMAEQNNNNTSYIQ